MKMRAAGRTPLTWPRPAGKNKC